MRVGQRTRWRQGIYGLSNRRRAMGLFVALGNRARGDRLAGLNVRAHKIRENLAVAPFLKRRIPHSSTLLPALNSATNIVGMVSRTVNVNARGVQALSISIFARWSLSE